MERKKASDAVLVNKAKRLGVPYPSEAVRARGPCPGPYLHRTPQCGVRAWTSLSHSTVDFGPRMTCMTTHDIAQWSTSHGPLPRPFSKV